MGIISILFVIFASGCGQFTYNIHAGNYGNHGVVIKKIAALGESGDRSAKLYPGFPGVRDNIMALFRIEGYENSLPDHVEVVWQLAELNECKRVYVSENYPGYTRKGGCKWRPLEDKVYSKVFDMEEVRQTDAYKKTGKDYGGIASSRYLLHLRFEFRDEELELVVENRVTNPWL